jgi:hypothetical protein
MNIYYVLIKHIDVVWATDFNGTLSGKKYKNEKLACV